MSRKEFSSYVRISALDRVIAGIERNAFWFCLAITLLAAFLRFHELGARSLWFDEAIEVIVARAPLKSLWSTALQQRLPDPPLSSLLLHMMFRIGPMELILRFSYALLGTMAVYASYHLFRLWLRPAGALVAQALLALAPAQVYYAQEAGQYALMVLMSVMIFWSFERALRRTNFRNLALFTLFAALGILSHYGVYWLLGGLALVLLWRRRPTEWIHWWPSGLALALVSVLIIVFFAWPQYQVLQAAYAASPTFDMEALRSLYHSLTKTVHLFSDFDGGWQGTVSLVTWFYIACFLIGLVVAIRKRSFRSVVALFFLPLLIAYLASKVGLFLWGPRYLLFVSPMFYLLLGIGLGTLVRFGQVGWVLPVFALGILLFNQMYVGWPNEERGEHLRPIIEKVQQDTDVDGGSVYVLYGARPAFEVYYAGDMERVRFGTWFLNQPMAEKMADVLPSFTNNNKTWFVASHYGQAELTAIIDQLDGHCLRTETLQESNVLAIKYLCDMDPIE